MQHFPLALNSRATVSCCFYKGYDVLWSISGATVMDNLAVVQLVAWWKVDLRVLNEEGFARDAGVIVLRRLYNIHLNKPPQVKYA